MGVTESECTLQRKQAQSYDAILKFSELSIDRTGETLLHEISILRYRRGKRAELRTICSSFVGEEFKANGAKAVTILLVRLSTNKKSQA